jgi:ureidoacrylate peracid hydrolase
MDPKSTAVVLIEYQNDFTTKGGTLHGAVKTVMDKTNMLANTVETVKRGARARCDHRIRADHLHRRLP